MSYPDQPYRDATPAAPLSGSSRLAAVLAHLSAPIAALLSAGSLSLLGPLIVWLVKKNDPYVRRAAAGADRGLGGTGGSGARRASGWCTTRRRAAARRPTSRRRTCWSRWTPRRR